MNIQNYKWEEMPTNVLLAEYHKLTKEDSNYYDISTIYTDNYLGMNIKYYKKFNQNEYDKKYQQLLDETKNKQKLADDIFNKTGIITQDEYNLLNPDKQKYYEIVSTTGYGAQSDTTYINTYQKITERNIERLSIANNIFNKITPISENEFNQLTPEQKKHYEIAEQIAYGSQMDISYMYTFRKIIVGNKLRTENENKLLMLDELLPKQFEQLSSEKKLLYTPESRMLQDGMQSYSAYIFYIKNTVKEQRDKQKREIEEQEKINKIKERERIMSKIIIYSDEYHKLTSFEMTAFKGIKSTQTDFTLYREGPNYYELYGREEIYNQEYMMLSDDYKQYYYEDKKKYYYGKTKYLLKNI